MAGAKYSRVHENIYAVPWSSLDDIRRRNVEAMGGDAVVRCDRTDSGMINPCYY